jgi:predicted transcriptional regulator
MSKIYGVDTTKKVTAEQVRDAVIACFSNSHCNDTGIDLDASSEYCKTIVKKAFVDSHGNFDNPDKESLVKALDELAEFSKNFRDQKQIEEHYSKMVTLANMIEE